MGESIGPELFQGKMIEYTSTFPTTQAFSGPCRQVHRVELADQADGNTGAKDTVLWPLQSVQSHEIPFAPAASCYNQLHKHWFEQQTD